MEKNRNIQPLKLALAHLIFLALNVARGFLMVFAVGGLSAVFLGFADYKEHWKFYIAYSLSALVLLPFHRLMKREGTPAYIRYMVVGGMLLLWLWGLWLAINHTVTLAAR